MTALLQEIPPHLFNLINDQSKNTEDWNQSRDPLLDVASGVIDLTALAELENIRIWNGRGASRRVAGVDIAKHMAEVFVLGIGKMPGSGAKHNGDPSGLFPNAVDDVFRCIGIPDNFRRPCQEAVAWLKADGNLEFDRMMQIRRAEGRSISLMAGAEWK